MDSTFENCISLQELNLSSFNTTRLLSMINCFKNTESLIELDIRNFIFNESLNITGAFDSLGKNTSLYINEDYSNIFNNYSNIIIMPIFTFYYL